MSFPAQRNGFLKGCKGIIGLDGTHLKGPYRGVLISTVTLDLNNLFPVAVSICEVENSCSWGWLLELLRGYLGDDNDNPITFMSDRQKGLIQL
ncbi:hypothetical protein Pint_17648 [Pistacia integerrima]|uniref:Uncharacterized protein n=1 Tax=Pistacia integerrima TaxID=434235 RepID=A0ACC0YWD8_9ROSI|nr:hypothetical protein Pint_17648 [Pistacia integerrima]